MPRRLRIFESAPRPAAALFVLALAATSPLRAASYAVDAAASVFAVVTHKAGFASGLAHNHLIVADRVEIPVLDYDPASPSTARFEATIEAAGLEVDRRVDQDRWQERVLKLGLLADAFTHPDDADRQKIRHDMLAAGQLDADRYPKIAARVAGFVAPAAGSQEALGGRLHLELSLHGKTIAREVAARIETAADGTLTGEAVGEFRFTEFGIRPFSAVLGAVKNEDRFHVFVHLVAKPKG